MGDRGNIAVIQDSEFKEQVWLYSHWGGSELPERLQRGLVAGRGRFTDYSYLTKILFGHAVPAESWVKETGWGISTRMQDNEHPILVVDCERQRVFTIKESELDDGRVPVGFMPEASNVFTFEEYTGLSPKRLSELA